MCMGGRLEEVGSFVGSGWMGFCWLGMGVVWVDGCVDRGCAAPFCG